MSRLIAIIWISVIISNMMAQPLEEASAHGKSDGHFHLNHIAMFAGATSFIEKVGTHFSLGVDYLRYFRHEQRWGISIFGEVILAEHTEWLFGIPIYYQFENNLWLRSGPGLEFHKEEITEKNGHEDSEADQNHTATESKTEFVLRIGMGYNIHVATITIAPSLDLDFLRSTTSLVWGINVGKGF